MSGVGDVLNDDQFLGEFVDTPNESTEQHKNKYV